jgi:hypothetical protein
MSPVAAQGEHDAVGLDEARVIARVAARVAHDQTPEDVQSSEQERHLPAVRVAARRTPIWILDRVHD